MKLNIRNALLTALCSLALTPGVIRAEEDLRTEADRTLTRFQTADSSLTNLLAGAAGYAIFPGVGKGGMFFGAEHGNGVVYEKGKPIGEATLIEINVGSQIGGQTFDEIIFFETLGALQHFKEGHYEVSAKVHATAGAEGAALNAKYREGVVVFTLPKSGLMFQASVGGQKFNFKPLPSSP